MIAMKIVKYIFVVIANFSFVIGAQAQSLKVTEKTKYYNISGKNPLEFAESMRRKGPYSRQHRSRAWATASRKMTYQLVHQKIRNRCRIKNVKVNMNITYTLPKLTKQRSVSKRYRNRWRKMSRLLVVHERVHGLYYKQFAKNVRRSLLKMKPVRNCSAFQSKAKAIVASLSTKLKKRNDRFDSNDTKNYRSMERLISRR